MKLPDTSVRTVYTDDILGKHGSVFWVGVEQYPDSKIYGANIGPIWGPQDPDGSHVGPMNFAIWVLAK